MKRVAQFLDQCFLALVDLGQLRIARHERLDRLTVFRRQGAEVECAR